MKLKPFKIIVYSKFPSDNEPTATAVVLAENEYNAAKDFLCKLGYPIATKTIVVELEGPFGNGYILSYNVDSKRKILGGTAASPPVRSGSLDDYV